jgi:hypothetical protein
MELRIRPGKNGHSVHHTYQPSPKLTKGLSGGMSMDQPPAEEHNFGPGQGNQMMQHIAQALALKGLQGGGADEGSVPQE